MSVIDFPFSSVLLLLSSCEWRHDDDNTRHPRFHSVRPSTSFPICFRCARTKPLLKGSSTQEPHLRVHQRFSPFTPHYIHTIDMALRYARILDLNLSNVEFQRRVEARRSLRQDRQQANYPSDSLSPAFSDAICIPTHASQPSFQRPKRTYRDYTESLDHSSELCDGLGALCVVAFLSFCFHSCKVVRCTIGALSYLDQAVPQPDRREEKNTLEL